MTRYYNQRNVSPESEEFQYFLDEYNKYVSKINELESEYTRGKNVPHSGQDWSEIDVVHSWKNELYMTFKDKKNKWLPSIFRRISSKPKYFEDFMKEYKGAVLLAFKKKWVENFWKEGRQVYNVLKPSDIRYMKVYYISGVDCEAFYVEGE